MSSAYLRQLNEGVVVLVKVQPRASRTEVVGVLGTELKIKVAAPPVDDAANTALTRFLAEVAGLSRSAVVIIRGHTSTHKQVLLRGAMLGVVEAKLSVGSASTVASTRP